MVHKDKQSLENVFDKGKKKESEDSNSKRKTPHRDNENESPPTATGTSNADEDKNINKSHRKEQPLSEKIVQRVSVSNQSQRNNSSVEQIIRPESNKSKFHPGTSKAVLCNPLPD